jgi:hypothetical protein
MPMRESCHALTWPPDWKDPNNYSFPKNTTRLEWAWQFLRRNPEYQKLWKQAIFLKALYNPAGVDANLQRAKKEGGVRHFNEQQISFWQATFVQRFGLVSPPPDPALPEAKLQFSGQFIRFAQKATSVPYRVSATLDDGQVLVWFDANWPIEPQLKNAKRLLTAKFPDQNVVKFRFHSTACSRFLRLLDAKQARARTTEQARILYPHLTKKDPNEKYPVDAGKRQVRSDLKRAELLCREPWRIVRG